MLRLEFGVGCGIRVRFLSILGVRPIGTLGASFQAKNRRSSLSSDLLETFSVYIRFIRLVLPRTENKRVRIIIQKSLDRLTLNLTVNKSRINTQFG